MIHIITPYRTDKDLGKAYNEAIAILPENDWVCIMDIDAMFLTPDAPEMIEKYIDLHPETGVFTCLCNRVSPLSHEQLFNRTVSDNADMLHHIEIARQQRREFPAIKPLLRGEISGYLMVFSVKTWQKNKFDEGIGCLAVDTYWSRRIMQLGLDIKVMTGIYIWHTYRLWTTINNKEHLYVKD